MFVGFVVNNIIIIVIVGVCVGVFVWDWDSWLTGPLSLIFLWFFTCISLGLCAEWNWLELDASRRFSFGLLTLV